MRFLFLSAAMINNSVLEKNLNYDLYGTGLYSYSTGNVLYCMYCGILQFTVQFTASYCTLYSLICTVFDCASSQNWSVLSISIVRTYMYAPMYTMQINCIVQKVILLCFTSTVSYVMMLH